MGLKKAGIRRLADILVANKKRYDQSTFGKVNDECGTVCCLAGFCYIDKIGRKKFNKLIKVDGLDEDEAVKAGVKQLGIDLPPHYDSPTLFGGIGEWPYDLRDEYRADGPRARVTVALKALQRLLPDGTIDDDPKAVHTRLAEQLEAVKPKGRE